MEAACVTKTTPVISTVSTEILARYKHYLDSSAALMCTNLFRIL